MFLPCLAAQLTGGLGGRAELAAGVPHGPAELHRHAQKFASLLAHTREQVEGEPASSLHAPVAWSAHARASTSWGTATARLHVLCWQHFMDVQLVVHAMQAGLELHR